MIYLDSSVALAEIMTEARRPDADFWDRPLVSSELLRFEIWNRLNAYDVVLYRRQRATNVVTTMTLLDMSRTVLSRSLERFPIPVRTLDGLHLATAHHLREQGVPVSLASYDVRMLAAAEAVGIPIVTV